MDKTKSTFAGGFTNHNPFFGRDIIESNEIGFGSVRTGGKTLSHLYNAFHKHDPDLADALNEAVMDALTNSKEDK